MNGGTADLRELAVMISVAYLRANPVTTDKVGGMIRETYNALAACATPAVTAAPQPRKRGRPRGNAKR